MLSERGIFAVIYTRTIMYVSIHVPFNSLPIQLHVLLSVSQFTFVFAFFKHFTKTEIPVKLVFTDIALASCQSIDKH